MNDENQTRGPTGDRESETGEPVSILGELDQEPSSGFMERIRHRIERRLLSSHVLSLTWHVPGIVIRELLELIFTFFPAKKEHKGGSQ